MEYDSLFIIGCILLYGVVVYRERNAAHEVALARLRRGDVALKAPARPVVWKFVSLGTAIAALLATALTLGWVGMTKDNWSPWMTVIAEIVFVPPAVLLLLIFIRDLRLYKKGARER